MTERRRYTKAIKAAAVVEADASSIAAASDKLGIPERTIAYWLDRPEFAELRAKTREEFAQGFQVLALKAQARLEQLIPTMEPRDLIVLAGVATEKSQLLAGLPTGRLESVTGGMDDHEKAQLREVLRRVIAQRSESVK